LSTEIEYSQPVLYKHFSGMDAIAEAIAIDGFGELNNALRKASSGTDEPEDKFRRIAHAYINFARANPALYDAMFTRTTTLHFAADDTPPELSTAFAGLRSAAQAVSDQSDVDTTTEVVWAALHGLATLSRSGRLRPEQEFERIELLADQFTRQ
jgi:AcrR family transcriptional regulator